MCVWMEMCRCVWMGMYVYNDLEGGVCGGIVDGLAYASDNDSDSYRAD